MEQFERGPGVLPAPRIELLALQDDATVVTGVQTRPREEKRQPVASLRAGGLQPLDSEELPDVRIESEAEFFTDFPSDGVEGRFPRFNDPARQMPRPARPSPDAPAACAPDDP
ncbi:hypothetical protein GCM10020000_76090 [Streptomyces olivoverticillatus]